MGNLSPHFDKAEFQCPCCGILKIEQELLDTLEELRGSIGCPLVVLSGYRCKAHNQMIGGEVNSQHCLGRAADILLPVSAGETLDSFYTFALAIGKFNGIGVYPVDGFQHFSFLHLDVRVLPEGKAPARWARVHGKYVGVQEGLDYIYE